MATSTREHDAATVSGTEAEQTSSEFDRVNARPNSHAATAPPTPKDDSVMIAAFT
jgi:hypothetical protein